MKIVLKEKATAQITHLVFANAQSQNTKNQKSNFLANTHSEKSKNSIFVQYARNIRHKI